MVTLIVEVVLPLIIITTAILAVNFYMKIQYPSPMVWGRIIPRVCPVRAHEVLDYNENNEGEEPTGWRLRREVRRKQFTVNWGYLRGEITNTTLFQQALRFEAMKIDPKKPGLDYERREVAILELVDQATALRWMQIRWQVILLLRSRLGLKIDNEMFLTLLAHYKNLEEQMITLAGTEGDWLHGMLVERLGLMSWRVIGGGQSEPEPA